MKVRKAVIPAAGLGTRHLPTSKSVPKELLPILDVPMLQHVAQEAAEAGIEEIIIVTSAGKEALAHYLSPNPALEEALAPELADRVRVAPSLARFSYVLQERPLGLGHAVLTAVDAVGDEPFVVILPDDIIWHSPGATRQMMDLFQRVGASVVAVEEVPWEAVPSYGVVASTPVEDRVHQVTGLVEKPAVEDAPSNLAIVGRYVLTPEIFSCLQRTTPGAKGEIQITDAMALLLDSQSMYAYQFHGTRYDGGTPLGLLRASVEIGLKREDTREGVLSILRALDLRDP